MMATKRLKRPRDPVQLAKLIGDIATGQVQDRVMDDKDPVAVAHGRAGGLKGGRARRERLSKEELSQIAALAAKARWKKK